MSRRRKLGRWRRAPSAWGDGATNEAQFERDRAGLSDADHPFGSYPFASTRLFWVIHGTVVVLLVLGTMPWPYALGALALGLALHRLVTRAFRPSRPWHRARRDGPAPGDAAATPPPVQPGDPPLPPPEAAPR